MSWSEDNLHRWMARRPRPSCLVGSAGHDAAVLRRPTGRPVVCVDQVVEGVHASLGTPARTLGRKAAVRALSDLAATAARPHSLLLALRAPGDASEADLRQLIEGVDRAGRRNGAPLVGGDLACAPGALSMAVTAHGHLSGQGKPPGRDRVRPGHTLLCTGPCGGSLLGRHLRIVPRLEAGLWLYQHGATALMDVSDGLAWDLYRLARASGVAIDLEQIPVHADARRASRSSGRSAVDHAMHDGEDHELLASVPNRKLTSLLDAARRKGLRLYPLGRARVGSGLTWAQDGLRRDWQPGLGGWKHGA